MSFHYKLANGTLYVILKSSYYKLLFGFGQQIRPELTKQNLYAVLYVQNQRNHLWMLFKLAMIHARSLKIV